MTKPNYITETEWQVLRDRFEKLEADYLEQLTKPTVGRVFTAMSIMAVVICNLQDLCFYSEPVLQALANYAKKQTGGEHKNDLAVNNMAGILVALASEFPEFIRRMNKRLDEHSLAEMLAYRFKTED